MFLENVNYEKKNLCMDFKKKLPQNKLGFNSIVQDPLNVTLESRSSFTVTRGNICTSLLGCERLSMLGPTSL